MTDHTKFEWAMLRVKHRLQREGKSVPTFRELLHLTQQEVDADELRIRERQRAAAGEKAPKEV